LDCGGDDLVLLFRRRNGCDSVIFLKTVVGILAVVSPFDDKASGRIGNRFIELLLLGGCLTNERRDATTLKSDHFERVLTEVS
jgi:hypothetical protein